MADRHAIGQYAPPFRIERSQACYCSEQGIVPASRVESERLKEGRRLPPEREALVGRFQREIEVGVTRMGDAADHLLGRQIDDRNSLRSQGVAPFAADEKPYVRIGMHEINRCSTLWRAGGPRHLLECGGLVKPTIAGIWDRLMDAVTRPSDDGVTMIDGTSVRVHHLAATLRADHQDCCLGRSRGGLTTKIHGVADGNGLPFKIAITPCSCP